MGKAVEFASGWLNKKKDNPNVEYISALATKASSMSTKPGIKSIKIELDNGEVIETTKFQVHFNENKKSEKAPDVRFVVFSD